MPFVGPVKEYAPPGDSLGDPTSSDSRVLKKPAKIREEADCRNKQLLEGAFHGTLHLPVSDMRAASTLGASHKTD